MKRILFLLFFLSSCSTSYQPYGWNGGYSDIQLSENMFRISFSGNDLTSKSQVKDFALLRAANLMYLYKYPYFLLYDKNENTEDALYISSYNINGNISSFASTISEHSIDLVVIGLKDNQVGAYDTVIVLNSIAKQYDLDIVDIVNKKDDD